MAVPRPDSRMLPVGDHEFGALAPTCLASAHAAAAGSNRTTNRNDTQARRASLLASLAMLGSVGDTIRRIRCRRKRLVPSRRFPPRRPAFPVPACPSRMGALLITSVDTLISCETTILRAWIRSLAVRLPLDDALLQ